MTRRWICVALVSASIALGCARIIAAYADFWQTWDEPAHIACGLQWWEKGEYSYERFHPPLARIFMAAGPYFAGLRGTPGALDHWSDGNTLLHEGGAYERNLRLARLGILPFFAVAAIVVALWTFRCAGLGASVAATFLFSLLPAVLAHSGLATLDMACAAAVAAALFAFYLWLESPGLKQSLFLGLFAGLAVASKFTSLPFLLAAGLAMVAVFLLGRRGGCAEKNPQAIPRFFSGSMIAVIAALVSIWAVYRFSLGPLVREGSGPGERFDAMLQHLGGVGSALREIAVTLPVPALDFFWGLFDLFFFRRADGHDVYFMGEVAKHGWATFFPVVFFLKTPVGFLLLVAAGVWAAFSASGGRHIFRSAATPFAAAVAVVVAATFATPHNGLRQILAVYPLLAVVAGCGFSHLWSLERGRAAARSLAALLVVWCAIVSFRSHPNYLGYFNIFAGAQPEVIVNDSDLDWGQDLKALAESCRRRGIDRLHLRYNGSKGIDLALFPLPEHALLQPGDRPSGWVAISVHSRYLGTGNPPYDQFAWLDGEQLAERVGSSILLYHIAP